MPHAADLRTNAPARRPRSHHVSADTEPLTNLAKARHIAFMEEAMATMNVSLPDPMKKWVEAQARTGRYANASDYVRDLIRRDQERSDKIGAMQLFVDEGLASDVGSRSKDELFSAALSRVEATRGA
jgi:antitoxin ParD1/3/4